MKALVLLIHGLKNIMTKIPSVEERERITKNLSELRRITLNGEVFISEEAIKGEIDNWSEYKILTPPTN